MPLFADESDRAEFLDIVIRSGEKNNFRVMAYCVAEADQYDLILDANGCDISKVMKEINIRYSIHKKCEGCLFRDRFQSELLSSALVVDQVEISTPVSDGSEVTGCREFFRCIEELKVMEDKPYESLPGALDQVYQRGCQERIHDMAEASAILASQLQEMGTDLAGLRKDKVLRNQLMMRMKACSTLSLKQLGEIFGGLSESSVSKIVNARPTE